MNRKKQRTKEEIEKEIINFVENLEFPTTSTEIGRVVRLNWFTAKGYLDQLKKDGRLQVKKVGRQNQWWIGDVREQKNIAIKAAKIEENNLKLKKDNLGLKEDNFKLKEEVKEVRGEIKEVKDENLKLKENNLKFEKEIKEMKTRIRELESK